MKSLDKSRRVTLCSLNTAFYNLEGNMESARLDLFPTWRRDGYLLPE